MRDLVLTSSLPLSWWGEERRFYKQQFRVYLWGGGFRTSHVGFIGEVDILQFSFPLKVLTPLLPWASLCSQQHQQPFKVEGKFKT